MGSKASMQYMIPAESRRRLVEQLGYKPEEVAVMDPTLAMSVLEKGVKRAWGDKPMPESWKGKAYQKGAHSSGGGGGGGGGLLGALKTILTVAIFGGIVGGGVMVYLNLEEEARKQEEARRRKRRKAKAAASKRYR